MRLLLAANNQATRRNEIIKSYLQLGSSSNRYAPRLPQQETKSSTKQLAPTDPILGSENLLKTGFAQKGLPSCPSGRHKPQSFIETKTLRFCNLDTYKKQSGTQREKKHVLTLTLMLVRRKSACKTSAGSSKILRWLTPLLGPNLDPKTGPKQRPKKKE